MIAGLAAVLITSCSPLMNMDASSDPSISVYDVNYKQKFLRKPVLQFAEFESAHIKKGWTTSYEHDFYLKFRGSKGKLQFDLIDTSGHQAKVKCMNRQEEIVVPVYKDWIGFPVKDEHFYSGVINTTLDRDEWKFVIYHPDDFFMNDYEKGFITNGRDYIRIEQVTTNEKGKTMWAVLGFNFYLNGELVASVETMHIGRILLRNDLPEEVRLVIASTSAAVIFRNQMGIGSI